MPLSLPDRRTRTGAGLVCLLVLSACNTQSGPGLSVRGRDVDVVFGARPKPVVRHLGTPPVGPVAAAPVDFGTSGYVPLPPELPDIQLPDGYINPPPIHVEDCPGALETATVAVAAGANVPDSVRPPAGRASWVVTGTVDGRALPRTLEERQITDVKDALVTPDVDTTNHGQAYTWSSIEPEDGGGYVRYSYAIKTVDRVPVRDVQVLPNTPQPPIGLPGPVPHPLPNGPVVFHQTVGAPDRGVTLTGVEHFDAQGSSLDRFSPPVGLLLLPTPITAGESWSSRSFDPTTQKLWTYTGQVGRRVIIDACGALLEGWQVTGTLSTDATAGTTFDEIFAPQYGGIVISEHRVEKVNGKTYDRTFHLGQQPMVVTTQ